MTDWAPTARLSALQKRAHIIHQIHDFFRTRDVLMVDTPLLCAHTVTDPYIDAFAVQNTPPLYLQTSPEYAMKRLLAAHGKAIYQISKAFRRDQRGRRHCREFTLLEWYRPGLDHWQLMSEVDALLQDILNTPPAEKISYQQLFLNHLKLDPLSCTLDDCLQRLQHHAVNDPGLDTITDALQFLMSHLIEPHLGQHAPCFLHSFPPEQAALAKINEGVAERFEVYIKGMELANGFHELTDCDLQRQRFLADQTQRRQQKKQAPSIDERLLSALSHGLPDCAGIAMGVDRLIMLATQQSDIAHVVTFTDETA